MSCTYRLYPAVHAVHLHRYLVVVVVSAFFSLSAPSLAVLSPVASFAVSARRWHCIARPTRPRRVAHPTFASSRPPHSALARSPHSRAPSRPSFAHTMGLTNYIRSAANSVSSGSSPAKPGQAPTTAGGASAAAGDDKIPEGASADDTECVPHTSRGIALVRPGERVGSREGPRRRRSSWARADQHAHVTALSARREVDDENKNRASCSTACLRPRTRRCEAREGLGAGPTANCVTPASRALGARARAGMGPSAWRDCSGVSWTRSSETGGRRILFSARSALAEHCRRTVGPLQQGGLKEHLRAQRLAALPCLGRR